MRYRVLKYIDVNGDIIYITNTNRKRNIDAKTKTMLSYLMVDEIRSDRLYYCVDDIEDATDKELELYKGRVGVPPIMNVVFDKEVKSKSVSRKINVLDRRRNILDENVTTTYITKKYSTRKRTIVENADRNARLKLQGYPPQPIRDRIYVYAD